MPTAFLNIAQGDCRKQASFACGFKALGYDVFIGYGQPRSRDDVLVIWNRHAVYEGRIRAFVARGCKVMVVENGYIGRYKAIAMDYHNGAGRWHVGEDDRWSRTGIKLAPWREDGDHILVLPQRGMGSPGVGMPRIWLPEILRELKAATKRPIVVRRHPGNVPSDQQVRPLEDDLRGAWAAVTWGSTAGIKAIVAGIPVFHCLPAWIGAPAATLFHRTKIEQPFLGDRLPMLHRLAWAQWSYPEIESGEALSWYLK